VFPLLFLLSALIGTVIAVDPIAASSKFILICIGVALSFIVPRLPERIQRILFAALPAIIALYFIFTNDWSSRLGKVPIFDPILRALSVLSASQSAFSLNSNVIGGLVGAYLPFQISALVRDRNQFFSSPSKARNLVCAAGLTGLSLLVLLISLSRGAWLALALVGLAWLLQRGLQQALPAARVPVVWMGLIALIVIALGYLLTATTPGNRFLDWVSGYRGPIWRDSFTLARDYAFTGIGLSHFEEFYSAYVLLVHVPFLYHAHNLFLDIWLGQGLLGLVAFGGWVLFALRDATEKLVSDRWNAAALTSLGVISIHGLFDDPFYGYGAYALPLLFVPLGVLSRRDGPVGRLLAGHLYMASGAAALAAAVLVWFVPSLRASLYANLGAITQARTELPGYTYQTWGVQDNLRRSDQISLEPAIAFYKQALILDPQNPTAHLRLGQIDLAHSQFEPACAHFLAAFKALPGNRAARQYVGECAAIAGETDKAIMLWRSIETGQGQLDIRYAWYKDFLADKLRTERISAVVQALSQ
jgi:O-antigen ligase